LVEIGGVMGGLRKRRVVDTVDSVGRFSQTRFPFQNKGLLTIEQTSACDLVKFASLPGMNMVAKSEDMSWRCLSYLNQIGKEMT
jgi:hypothetical protein